MTKESAIVVPIICALVVAIAPHTLGLPLWINAWCLVMWGYMLVRLKTGWPLPGAPVRYGLTFTGIIGLLLTYRVQIGADAFIGLLALMAAVKPFEMATHRHQMITVLLTNFIFITSLFRSESMFIVLYMFFSVFITTIALGRLSGKAWPGEMDWKCRDPIGSGADGPCDSGWLLRCSFLAISNQTRPARPCAASLWSVLQPSQETGSDQTTGPGRY